MGRRLTVFITTRDGRDHVYRDVYSTVVWDRASSRVVAGNPAAPHAFLVLNFESGLPKLVPMSEIMAYRKEVS